MKIILAKRISQCVKWFFYVIGILILTLLIIYGVFLLITKPSNNRNWVKDMRELSSATVEENIVGGVAGKFVTLNNIRNNYYRSTSDFDVKYYQAEFDVKKLKKAYLITDPFGKLASHTMLDFEFDDGQKVVLSVEIRREEGEVFENLKGMFRGYELYYVWANERDVVKLRTNYRKDNVYMYPLDMAEENIQKLFLEAVRRTNELKDKPEFYNLLVNNCTTNLAKMLQVVYNKKIIVDWRYLAPAYAEGLSMKYDLLQDDKVGGDGGMSGGDRSPADGSLESIKAIRKTHNISPKALECGDCVDYSGAIRRR